MGGGFEDIALVMQAKKAIRIIRNAIEEYKLDHGYYPSNGCDLKLSLAPYLSKEFYKEGEDVPKHVATVMGAQKNLEQINSILSGCTRIKEVKVEKILYNIQEIIKGYENLLAGEKERVSPLSNEVEKLIQFVSELRPLEKKKLFEDSLLTAISQVISLTTMLEKALGDTEKLTHIKNIKETFSYFKSKLTGEKIEKKEFMDPKGEIDILSKYKDLDVSELAKKMEKYYELNGLIDYYQFLYSTQKELERCKEIALLIERRIGEINKSAVIVRAQSYLHQMANALSNYRRKYGEFPTQNANIDSILHLYFIETTISGEKIDRWQDVLSWLSKGPIYKTKDNKVEFVLEANVNNDEKTYIMSCVFVKNKWDEIMDAFSSSPIYSTQDSLKNYFIKARAKDSGLTWVTDRPPTKG